MKQISRKIAVPACALMLALAAGCGNGKQETSAGESAPASSQLSAESITQPQASAAEASTQASVEGSRAQSSEMSKADVSEVSDVINQSSQTESSSAADEELLKLEHPRELVGNWVLKLDTKDMSNEEKKAAQERMDNTSVTLHADGRAVGYSSGVQIPGCWGVKNDYIYLDLDGAMEAFTYYVDTLVSVSYSGMYFVR